MSRAVIQTLHILAALVALRAALILVGANIEQPLVAALVALTDPLAGPFEGIFPQPADEAGVIAIDLGALVACAVIEVIAFSLGRISHAAASIP